MKKARTRKAIVAFATTLIIMLLAMAIGASAATQTVVRGDMNSDGKVNIDDALYLLRHTLMPGRYAIYQSGDVNGDGTVNIDDALYLLRHTLMPRPYPLACPHDEIVIDAEKHPTCAASGLTEGRHCKLCGKVLAAQEVIPATGHAFGEWHKVEMNGCANVEYSLRVCGTCGYVEYDCEFGGELHPHAFKPIVTAATCTTSGHVTVKCENCGIVGADEIINPLGHCLNWVLTESTHSMECVREGCDYKISSQAHEADTNSPCIDAHCKVCGCFMREGIGHIMSTSYSSDERLHWKKCTRSGCGFVQSAGAHRNSTAICTDTTAACEICRRQFVPSANHSMSEWYQTLAATCTTTGERRRDCVNCDHYQTKIIPAEGHDMGEWRITTIPTETVNGSARRDCSKCDYYELRTVAATGHRLGSWYVTLDPTCTSSGSARRDCSHCDYYEAKTIPALGHYCSTWHTVEGATCTDEGGSYGYCTRCGAYMTRVDASLGHEWGDYHSNGSYHWRVCKNCGLTGMYAVHNMVAQTETVESTDDGSQIRYIHKLFMTCSDCGHSMTTSTVFRSEHYGCTVMPAVEPTCTSSGLTWGLKCSVPGCGEIYQAQETVPALGHNYVSGVCTRCGDRTSSGSSSGSYKHSHVGVMWITEKQPTCTEAGQKSLICRCGHVIRTETLPIKHSFGDWTQTTAPTCTEAGVETRTCQNCTHYETRNVNALGHDPQNHAGKAATCTEGGWEAYVTCSRCDYTTYKAISTLGHDYENGACARCGDVDPDAAVQWSEGLSFALNADGQSYYVSGIGTCTDTNVVIPAVYNGKPVTSIGEYAFYNRSSLTSITIPEGVTSIGDSAFWGCSILTSITIPNSVTSIGGGAFADCSALKSITIPDGVTSIDDVAFDNCSKLTSITIPEGVTRIGVFAFSDCISLESITIQNSVTSIDQSAFEYCSSLTSITIPDSVTSIGNYAFEGCSSLTSITIPNSVTSIGDKVFSDCSSLTSITIPEGVTSIGWSAFEGCSSLESITIPNSVTSIGWSAFEDCSSLESITIPNSVTSIGWSAFEDCSSLRSITIPDSVNSIDDRAFFNTAYYENNANWENGVLYIGNHLIGTKTSISGSYTIKSGTKCIANGAFKGCSSLESIAIPDGVTSIDDYAFYYCSSLTSITIPDSVTSIGGVAFSGCSNLTSITIPEGVTSIGGSAFSHCSSLTSIMIPEGVTSIDDYAFYYCSSLTSITIPDSVTSIGNYAFQYCSSLTSITIPDGVMSIGNYAFQYCSSLTNITIPEGVTRIRIYAFSDCSSLTSITIPEGVTSIGGEAFKYCSSLTSITFEGTKDQWKAINKGTDWNSNTPAYTIHCTDGDLSK